MFNWLDLRSLTLKPPSTSKLHQQDKTTIWTEQNIPIQLLGCDQEISRVIWRIPDVLPDKIDMTLCCAPVFWCILSPRRHTQCSGGKVVGILLTSRPNWIIFLAFFLRRGMNGQRALYAKQARVSTSLRVSVLISYFSYVFDQFFKLIQSRIHPLPITSPSLRIAARHIFDRGIVTCGPQCQLIVS